MFDQYEQKLQTFIQVHALQAEHLHFQTSCHSVTQAALAVNASIEQFVKNICLFDKKNTLIVAIVAGSDRVSTTKVAKAMSTQSIRLASPEEILRYTGYPCGGTPSFGFTARFFIDPRVMEKEVIYTGGGSEYALVKINTIELQQANKGQLIEVRK